MASSMMFKLTCVLVACMLVMSASCAEATITCGFVASKVAPCVNYLRGTGGAVPPACCTGVRTINAAATSTPDRQTACRCLKTTASSIKGLNQGLVSSLPNKCGVSIPYPISPSTDCSKVR
ncbi:hypothetical protein AQUCO_04500226v1 [Aquilegia coerulea]|uniref:Non-specific lipid-transfer protein n=1 Tax=Aquilegia coerulea TaxID=218851 RepID=A0A2G5CMI7_AQUCA|nr:hypothetical protein AQUCO_04500226v1 [Aquilegia coerulea]